MLYEVITNTFRKMSQLLKRVGLLGLLMSAYSAVWAAAPENDSVLAGIEQKLVTQYETAFQQPVQNRARYAQSFYDSVITSYSIHYTKLYDG